MATDCLSGITKGITSNCSNITGGGLEATCYLMNRKDILTSSITYDTTNTSKVTTFAMNSTKRAWIGLGYKNNIDAKFGLVTSETRPNRYTHTFSMEGYEFDAAGIENITNAEDIVVIVERKDKGLASDGEFIILGLEQGLWKTTDDWDSNANNGVRLPVWASPATGEKVPYHILDVGTRDATLAFLTALLTPAV